MTAVAAIEAVDPGTAPSPASSAMARVAEIQRLVAEITDPRPAGGFSAQLTAAAAPAAAAGLAGIGASAPAAGAAVPYADLIDAAAARHGVDPSVLRGLIRAESDFNPRAGSSAGAQGLTQLMPATQREFGITDPYDPAQSIDGGARELRQCLDAFGGDYRLALAAYNAGIGAVKRYGGIPPYAETQAYVPKVLGYAEQYRSQASAAPVAAAPISAGLPTGGYGSYSTT